LRRRGRRAGEEAADAACGAYHQDGVAFREVERVQGGHSGDAGQRGGACRRELHAGRLARDEVVLGNDDQLGPAAVVDGRVGMRQEPVDLVAFGVVPHAGADLLDAASVVAAEHDGELVVDHALEHPGCDGAVGAVDRGGAHAHEHFVVGRRGCREVLAQAGGRVETV
jgi:hypothetical protein